MRAGTRLLAGLGLLLAVSAAAAETLYITGQLQAGLHEDKRLDSPIVTVVPTGTAMEIIKREDDVSFVRTPDGASGWIDNSYLVAQEPGQTANREARDRIQALQQQLAEARKQLQALQQQAQAQPDTATVQQLRKANADLERQLKAEKLKSGDLQVQLSELHKQMGVNSDNKSLYRKIADLSEKNKELEVELARARDNPGSDGGGAVTAIASGLPWSHLLAYLGIAAVLGALLGVYIMDTINRRRHGGFRV